jgi:hypothetical protein
MIPDSLRSKHRFGPLLYSSLLIALHWECFPDCDLHDCNHMVLDEIIVNIPILSTAAYKLNSLALFRKRTIPAERPPLVGEGSDNFCG